MRDGFGTGLLCPVLTAMKSASLKKSDSKLYIYKMVTHLLFGLFSHPLGNTYRETPKIYIYIRPSFCDLYKIICSLTFHIYLAV